MICPRCKTEVNDDMNFCPQCGMKIDRCPQCGQPVITGAKYCSHCGANIQQPTKTSRLDGYYEPLSENKHTDEPEQKEVFQDVPVNKKVNKKVIIISVSILVIASVLSYIYIYHGPSFNLQQNQQETRKVEAMTIGGQTSFSTHTGNINQNGTVYQTDNKIYMCDDNGYLISMDKNLENKKTLVSEACQYINVVDNTIYYTNKNNVLCQVSTDGGNQKVVLNQKVYYVVVKNNKIYYQLDEDNESIYVYDLKTNQATQLNKRHSYNLNVLDDYIYFTSDDGIYRMGINGQGEEKLLSGKIYNLIYQNEKLYYLTSDKKIQSYDINSKEVTDMTQQSAMLINMNDQYLFFYSGDYNVMRYDLKTKQTQKLYSGIVQSGQVIGDKLILNTGMKNSKTGQYQVIMDFNGEQQQRLFVDSSGDYI
ncbi:DUF5050 domain-containing protein [Candidatus Stoquefichus sp. SB1]|uniref:DUF5050 domain-containing protein n=1 Tax=Candidatus Stoquefichus sp. SB1 TaxID=1658109 RepID=UPI00067F1A87|nr:DUF5050 domain-containing protein [Candidatus Stoquefichus sp. SB1]